MVENMSEQTAGPEFTGGEILVKTLQSQGVTLIYCVPGESYLPVLDALHDAPEIRVVSARHEGAAANMAEADGKLTGKPGICFVTRGPGATHAAIGVHTAFQDSTPMILFIGQVARNARDREGFQEVDFRAMFTPLAKWAAEIDDPARIPEYVQRAYHTAMSGRPGPVVLSLPEDMLSEKAVMGSAIRAVTPSLSAPRKADLDALRTQLESAHRPLLIVGGSGWTQEACHALRDFAARNALPIVSSFRRQDLIDNRDANYCGHLGLGVFPALAKRLTSADVVVAIGSRLSENTTSGYTLLIPPVPRQTLVHIHPDANELGRVYQPTIAIGCGLADFALSLSTVDIAGRERRRDWLREARSDYVAFSTPGPSKASGVNMAEVVGGLSSMLPQNSIITNGAGNYTVWVHRYFRYKQPRTELAPVSGAMGYGVPAAIAAALRFPDRRVVAFAGDGCFLMYPQEIGTAIQYGAKIVIIVVNNGIYGTIRMHQERRYPGRVVGTDIQNPDFVALAMSYGAYAERIEDTRNFEAAFDRALRSGKAALLELVVDPAQISPNYRIEVNAFTARRG
jgi:acetolactate synthase I/II/III large subunit